MSADHKLLAEFAKMAKPDPKDRPEVAAPGESGDDMAVALAERQLRDLEELRGIGMEIARGLKAQLPVADQPAGDAPAGGEIALAYGRVARAVRQIVALEQETVGLREKHRANLRAAREHHKKQIVRRAVRDSIVTDTPDISGDKLDGLLGDLFDFSDDYDDFDRGEPEEVIARICRDIGIQPRPILWNPPAQPAQSPGLAAAAGTFGPPVFKSGPERKGQPPGPKPNGRGPPS